MQAKRLEIIDFLRGFSIFTIVVMHLMGGYDGMGTLKKVLAFGGAGVHVFILCSGFGLYLSHLRKPLSYPQFLQRRFSKIWLPYAIAVGCPIRVVRYRFDEETVRQFLDLKWWDKGDDCLHLVEKHFLHPTEFLKAAQGMG